MPRLRSILVIAMAAGFSYSVLMHDENPETEITEHQEIYHGRIITLTTDIVRLASGTTVLREVVEHPGGAVAIPVLDDGKLLLVRQFRYPIRKFILEFPAGKLEPGQSPLENVARELQEEAGYRAGLITHEFSVYTSPGFSTEIIHIFVARNLTPVPMNPEEGEHITVETHTLEECLDKVKTGEIMDAKTILGILWMQFKNALK
jgi:ADP-ribose pyrophosphatase